MLTAAAQEAAAQARPGWSVALAGLCPLGAVVYFACLWRVLRDG